MENFTCTIDEIAPIMTVPEVANFLGVGRNCVYNLIRSGQLEALHFGRRLKVARHSLLRFIGIQDR